MNQRAQVDFMARPDPTIALIVGGVKAYHGFTYTDALARYAVKVMRSEGIVGNGSHDTFGDFEPTRIRRLVSNPDPDPGRPAQAHPAEPRTSTTWSPTPTSTPQSAYLPASRTSAARPAAALPARPRLRRAPSRPQSPGHPPTR